MNRIPFSSVLFTLLLAGLLGLILHQHAILVAAREPTGWEMLLEAQPVPHLKPLPEPVPGPFDGVYAKLVAAPPMWWKCYRCADYRVSGGLWKLQFDRGVMRVYYDATGWHSLASFTVSGNQLTLFNDPWCAEEEGHYTWQQQDGRLQLTPVHDSCAFELRAATLTEQAWQACLADPAMPGCQATPFLPAPILATDRNVTVKVYSGDSRFFTVPPEVVAFANQDKAQQAADIVVQFSSASVPFGVHRVLWWDGNWIEATTSLPFTAIGVQFFGEGQMGWARLLFDGEEVWNGNTAEIGYENYRHGGYVEISGFAPGQHTIRAESLGFDFRPVTVVSFGFNKQGGVQPRLP